MDQGRGTPTVTQVVKFINEKSDYTATIENNSWNHHGRTHSSGVRYTSGHKECVWNVVVKDENDNIVYDKSINSCYPRPSDFTVWVFCDIMKRKHWRYDQSTVRRGEPYTFEEEKQIEIENERNDPTRD